jgi:hypothetical protein
MARTAVERHDAALADGHAELFWWHRAICGELDRIGGCVGPDGQARPVYPVPGIAGNLRGFLAHDAERYARELIAAGVLVETAPRWAPDAGMLWVGVPGD